MLSKMTSTEVFPTFSGPPPGFELSANVKSEDSLESLSSSSLSFVKLDTSEGEKLNDPNVSQLTKKKLFDSVLYNKNNIISCSKDKSKKSKFNKFEENEDINFDKTKSDNDGIFSMPEWIDASVKLGY